MKLAIVYNPYDNKTRPDTYSYVYRGMLDSIIKKLNNTNATKETCEMYALNCVHISCHGLVTSESSCVSTHLSLLI